jgi:hypothetical protein
MIRYRCMPRAVVCFVLLGAAWADGVSAGEPARVTTRMPLAEYARQAEGREFYGAYLLDGKIGWVVDTSRLAQHEGRPVLEAAFEMHLEIGRGSDRSQMSLQSVTRYALDGDGLILSIEETETQDASILKRSAVRSANGLRITTLQDGRSTEHTAPVTRDTLKLRRDLEAWLAAGPKKGEQFTTWEADLEDEAGETQATTEFIESARLVWGGVPVNASRVMVESSGARFAALIGPGGQMLNGKVGGLFEFRAEEESVAKARDSRPVDMLAASQIRVDKPLGDNNRIQALTVELSGLGDFQVPQSARQRVRPLDGGKVMVELSRESAQPASAPLSTADRQKYLRATPTVQSDDSAIRAQALQIVGDTKDAREAATRLVGWVHDNLRATYGADASTATAVLAQKAGDCTEHTLLFTALARAAGIPTRQVGGVMYSDKPSPMFGWHAWAEIHDGTGWVSVDPTWRQVRVDPTHVLLSVGDDSRGEDLSWVNVVGALKIRVEKVETGG